MYRHIGSGAVVRERDVIGIFDLDGEVTPRSTAAFLGQMEKEGKVFLADREGLPKCFLLLAPKRRTRQKPDRNRERVLFSSISAARVAGRGERL